MKTLSILFILTSHGLIGDQGKATGLWLEELSTPYYAFIDAGFQVEIASIKGGATPIDPRSQKQVGENPASVERFLQDTAAMRALNNSQSIDGLNTDQYAAVFLPGGHGTMFDLPNSQTLARIVADTLAANRIVAAVCHGPAGLVSATFADGRPVVQGKRVTAFSNAEEEAVGLTDDMPFLLESRLRALGAEVITAPNFTPHALADGNLMTGQNPASSETLAKLVIDALQSH